jgi:hypothetical protein
MRGYLSAVAAVAAALTLAQPAQATDFNVAFDAGTYNVDGPNRTTTGTFTDNFSFSVLDGWVFSGSLTTTRQRLDPPGGPIVSDMDFISGVLLRNGAQFATFTSPAGMTDVTETYALAPTELTAGDYVFRLTYNVQNASGVTAATYGGQLNLAQSSLAVPEPATWAMMLGGFGLVGGTLRRRQAARMVLA